MLTLLYPSLVCNSRFDVARRTLPKPLRPLVLDFPVVSEATYTKHRDVKRRELYMSDTGRVDYNKMRSDRRSFKNIHIYFSELPKTPTVSNVRSKKQDSSRPAKRRKLSNSRVVGGKSPPTTDPLFQMWRDRQTLVRSRLDQDLRSHQASDASITLNSVSDISVKYEGLSPKSQSYYAGGSITKSYQVMDWHRQI